MAQTPQNDRVARGSVADLVIDIIDESEVLTAPFSAPTIVINGPDGAEVVPSTAMTLEALGRYVYYHQTTSSDQTGFYKATASVAVVSGRTETKDKTFEVY